MAESDKMKELREKCKCENCGAPMGFPAMAAHMFDRMVAQNPNGVYFALEERDANGRVTCDIRMGRK